ncbi:MAG: HAD family phosphatase [Candidatus Eremiobacteraeota bacterium]|nr:HAD family phosphatase [Candidatus Eremiobacteraeota bacterium]
MLKALPQRVLFLSDLDGTWLSQNPANRRALDEGVQKLKDTYEKRGIDLEFGYVTARPPVRVEKEHLPRQDWTITFNGGFIHQGRPGQTGLDGAYHRNGQDDTWEDLNAQSGFRSDKVAAECRQLLTQPRFANLKFHTVGEVVHNAAADDCPFIASFCFDEGSVNLTPAEQRDDNHNGVADIFEEDTFAVPSQVKEFQDALGERLRQDGIEFDLSPAYPFHGQPIVMFDAASPIANKGSAVDFLRAARGVERDHLIIAGDGGNDIAMMRAPDGSDDGRRAIVVGANPQLHEAGSKLKNAIVRPADEDSSLGVLRALEQHLEAIAGG